VATKPADWFSADTYPLLASYCRHVQTLAHISRRIDAIEIDEASDGESARKYDELLKLREREVRTMNALAQSRYKSETAATAADRVGTGKKPWEYGT
jgi:mannose/fructose/N-acetylgalactosamine-specific phosphotransferase system component IIB